MTTQTTRRALIGGASLVGVALIAPAFAATPAASATVSRAAWEAALARRDAAWSEWDARMTVFDRAATAYFADKTPVNDAEYDRAEAEEGRFCNLDSEARLALNATPAPDTAAAIYKLEEAIKWHLPTSFAVADLRRLAKLEG